MQDSFCGRLAGTFVTIRDGFAACGLRTEELELVVVPGLGAAIASLRSVRSGREWMWRPPGAGSLFANGWGDPFERSPLTGAVECVPTIAACRVAGRELPDHGEAWTASWEISESAFRDGCIRTSVRLPVSRLSFSRSIRLNGPVARFEYRIDNPAQEAVPYLWAFHPLFTVENGDRLELPTSIRCVRVGESRGYPGLAATGTWDWPAPRPGIRLDRVGCGPEDSFVKMFARFIGPSSGWAALCRGAERLEFRFDPSEIPYLALWLTHGGWHGFTHLAIEPTSHMADSLAEVRTNLLPGSGGRYWKFDISLTEAT